MGLRRALAISLKRNSSSSLITAVQLLFRALTSRIPGCGEIEFAFGLRFRHVIQSSVGSGRSVAWLARVVRVHEVVSSNLTAPTIFIVTRDQSLPIPGRDRRAPQEPFEFPPATRSLR